MMAFIERFFWTMIWVIAALIVGVWLLHAISNAPGWLGNIGDWIGKKIEY